MLSSEHQKSGPFTPCVLWPVDLKLTHLDWNPEATLIHFQGQYLTVCELDYNILQREIQNAPKAKAAVDIGEFCLVEDLTSARWYRGRVQNRKEDLFDVFLIDHGNVLSVSVNNIFSCSNDLFSLPPKIVCGFLANVLLQKNCPNSAVDGYFSNLVGKHVTGYIQALLPHKVLLLEAPDINNDLVRQGFGRYVDTDTFCLLVEMLTEVPLKQHIEPVPDLLIEKPRERELFFKSSGLQRYKNILTFCGPRLSRGTRAEVRVTAAINPQLFYCQMATVETDLLEMSKKLTAACEGGIKKHNEQNDENLGLLCAMKGRDGGWYRGIVQFLPVNSQVRVLFVDYGFFDFVNVENIHRLPHGFDSTHFMAFPCSLFAVNDQDEAIKAQQLSFLKAGLLGGVLDVEIRDFDEKQHSYSITVSGVIDNYVKKSEPVPIIEVELDSKTEDLSSPVGSLYQETIMCKMLNKTLEIEEVEEGSAFVGYVEHVKNPYEFWVRTQKRCDDFEELMIKTADHFRQKKLDEDVLLHPERGTLCCAMYEKDMHFYRAVVIDILERGSEVLFIDFGNTEKVPHKLIKKIPKELASISAFAFCCSLVNVFPLDDVWSSTTCNFFRRAVSNKSLLVHVLQMRKNRVVVELCEMEGDNAQSISELMLSSKHAEFWNKIPINPEMEKNTSVTENTRCPRSGGVSDTCWETQQVKICNGEEGKSCRSEAEKAQPPVSIKALNIKPGYEFSVSCSYINSPSDFWCQPLDKIPALEELMDKIQLYYSTHMVALQSGDSCCVARSPQDGKWYRVFITDQQKGHYNVMSVDYGYTFQVEEHNIQGILPEYGSLERQAFKCSLYNLVEPADPSFFGDWSTEACNSLKEFVHTRGLRCNVVSQLSDKSMELCNVVELYNTKTQESITNLLLEKGLAREVTVSTRQLSPWIPESFVYSSFGLSPGTEEQVYVTLVSSQWEVYCHLERNIDAIEELERKISEEREKMMQASTKGVVGRLCLAKYLDGKWYRGLVHPVQSPLHLSVFFVDYGNTKISEKMHVMFIPRDSADLLYSPMQALRFSLASVPKGELFADVNKMLDDTIVNQQVRALIVGKGEDGSFDVNLFVGEVNINEKVNELIGSLSPKPKTVLSSNIKNPKTGRRPLNGKNTAVEKWEKHRGRESRVSRGPCKSGNKKDLHHKAKGKHAKQQSEKRAKSCVPVKLQKNPQVTQQSAYCGANTKSEQPKYIEKINIPQLSCLPDTKVTEGFKTLCYISHINSVHSFFLQLSEDEPAILKMVEDLNSSGVRDSVKSTTSLTVNDLVLAVYEEDGALYRSVVKDCEGSSSFTVEFVDYGNSAVLVKEKIYSIPTEYLSQPRFGIPCSLLDTNNTLITDTLMEKPLLVEFIRQLGTHWEVDIEIPDEAASPPEPLEAASESDTDSKKTDTLLVSSPEREGEMESCEQNNLIKVAVESETAEIKRATAPESGEKAVLTALNTHLPRLKVSHQRIPTKKKTRYKKKTKKTSVKPKRDSKDAVISLNIKSRDIENCTVLSVKSNGNFYIRPERASDLLSALESRIADNLYKCEFLPEDDVRRGLECLVQVQTDKQWHRAVVQDVRQRECQVFLSDHGITEEISTCSVRQRCSNLSEIPHLAVLCRISSFGFTDTETVQKWWFQSLKAMIGSKVRLMFMCYSEADNLWKVEVILNSLLLIRETSLQQKKKIIAAPTETQNENWQKNPSLDTSQPQRLVFAPVKMDTPYTGFAGAVTTPFKFYVILEDSLVIVNKVFMILEDLSGEMPPLAEVHLIPGTCCLLKSDTKNKWCRAEIVHSDSTVILNLVDYGHCECIPYKNCIKLKRLPGEISNLPKVAYPCSLRGVGPVEADGQWSDEAVFYFQQCLNQKNLQIFFIECVSDTQWKVDIVADDVHVAKALVDAGYASYTDDMLGLRFQQQSPDTAAILSPDSGDEDGQEDEDSQRSSQLSLASDESEGMTSPRIFSATPHCSLF